MKRILVLILAVALFPVEIFAGDVNLAHTKVNVTVASGAVSSRSTRRILILQNMSDAVISCKAGGATAVAGEGIVLNPQLVAGSSGGVILFDVETPTGVINCIHGGAGDKVILVSEG